MIDMNYILGGKRKGKPIKNDILSMDRILPKIKNEKEEIDNIPTKKEKIIIHHYHMMPERKPMNTPRRLTVLNGEKAFQDNDRDMVPNPIDPYPNNPNRPMRPYRKVLDSIYSGR